MENPMFKYSDPQDPKTLSPSSSGRRRSSDSNSPEFEFWMVRNPSFPQPNLVSADELFVDGVLLPLHLLNHHHDPPDPKPDPPITETPNSNSDPPLNPETNTNSNPPANPEPGSGPELSPVDPLTSPLTASKRWKQLFKKSDGKNLNSEDKEKEKKKEKKSGGGGNGSSSAELNINIWPFSRSRSAGNGGTRPRMAAGSAATRKVSSAPCSRSNSAGESKSRKWPSSPSRGGVHLGRSSPVWQVRRGGSGLRISEPAIRNVEKVVKKEPTETRRNQNSAGAGFSGESEAKPKVLNLNVPMCIGYRHHLSCRSDGNSAVGVAAGSSNGATKNGGVGSGGRGSNIFNLRSLFTKKVY